MRRRKCGPPAYLLRLSVLELLDRQQRMLEWRIRAVRFPAVKSMDTFDLLAIPSVNKVLATELARCEYVERRENVIAVGSTALLDRLTHPVHIWEMSGESCRLKHNRKSATSQSSSPSEECLVGVQGLSWGQPLGDQTDLSVRGDSRKIRLLPSGTLPRCLRSPASPIAGT